MRTYNSFILIQLVDGDNSLTIPKTVVIIFLAEWKVYGSLMQTVPKFRRFFGLVLYPCVMSRLMDFI